MATRSILDSYFGPALLRFLGVDLPKRSVLNFQGSGVTVEDNRVTQATDITISGGGGGGVPAPGFYDIGKVVTATYDPDTGIHTEWAPLPQATDSMAGVVTLRNDFGGTYANPRVVAISGDDTGTVNETATMVLRELSSTEVAAACGEIVVSATTETISVHDLTASSPCVVTCRAIITAQDADNATTSLYVACPVGVFKWDGATVTRINSGVDADEYKASFVGGAEWVASGETIALSMQADGNATFGYEIRAQLVRT